jgi:hypothetical protein
MTRARLTTLVAVAILALSASSLRGAEPTAVERGKQALLGRAYSPPALPLKTYQDAWRKWGTGAKQPPEPYAEAYMERYGLAAAPYPNDGYPMGVRPASSLLAKGLTIDCMLCHGGSIAGQSVIGLGNASLDLQSLFGDLGAAGGNPVSNRRGTLEPGRDFVSMMRFRNPDLTFRSKPLDLPLPPKNLYEDVPAWWLLKKKKTMYHIGMVDARSVRALMQFLLLPLNTADMIKNEERAFADIQAYLLGLQPPKYPFPVNEGLAHEGEKLFSSTCAKCHGTYGENWKYPNKIVPLKVIGTDRRRYDGLANERHYLRHADEYWFAQEKIGPDGHGPYYESDGYQAPPLDGVWATAPYFHNASVPTVYHVLNSKARPNVYTRSYRTDKDAYDPDRLGWKIRVLDKGPDPGLSGYERRKVYDAARPGCGNQGHTFGDHFTDAERTAVIEYLKTL